MKSRSYYAIAVSSLLLLLIACSSQNSRPEERTPEPSPDVGAVDTKAVALDENVKADGHEETDGHEEEQATAGLSSDAFEHVKQLGAAGTSRSAGGIAKEGEETTGKRPRSVDGCERGEMRFEGTCMSKEKVTEIIDQRKREAMDSYRKAKRPEQAAQAAHELLEQQVVQVEKTEDDLDEILETLREDQEQKKDGGKKEGS